MILIERNLPKDHEILNTSCWHVGAKACKEKAISNIVKWVLGKSNRYWTFGGDALEGKQVASPHFKPSTLRPDTLSIQQQCNRFADLIKPIASRLLVVVKGNHDAYLSRDIEIWDFIFDKIGIKNMEVSAQVGLIVNGKLGYHFYHGWRNMPRGSKDPIQREGNQKAWLKNELSLLGVGWANAMYMAHIHKCMIQPPIQSYTILAGGKEPSGRKVTLPDCVMGGTRVVPIDSRWYVATGSLRRSGGFGYEDYSEVAGFPPIAPAYTVTQVQNNKILNIIEVQA